MTDSTFGQAGRNAVRLLALLVALAALLATTSFGGLATTARAAARPATTAEAGEAPPSVASPKRAVVVVGPVGGLTSNFLSKGRAIADAAAAQGMEVTRIFHPYATWSRVVEAANGADLFVYAGHGNGWPSPYPPFQEDTKDGLGLNPTYGETDPYKVKYKGADHIRAEIRFAPNAIVILNKLCYSAGNGEEGQAIPTRAVAIERVDNYASGFLYSGARTVFHLTWQPGGNIVDALFETHATMDEVFKMRFGSSSDPSVSPYYGYVGWKPDFYFDSVRTPGARLHLDPHSTEGYLRALSGDLDFTTDEWLNGGTDPSDSDPPVLSDLTANQPANTIPATESALPVFTPNGDGLSDSLTLRHRLSEPAYLAVRIERAVDDVVVRRWTAWSTDGATKSVWDGRNSNGKIVGDGRFRITITPKDRAGNVGEPQTVAVKVLTAIKGPAALPTHFDPTDGDALAPSTTLSVSVLDPASVTWVILDATGTVVRTGIGAVDLQPGIASWLWDGLDDAGQPLPRGTYTSRVTATTEKGTYGHWQLLRVMPFWLTASDRTVVRGQTIKLRIRAAERVDGKPTVTVKQPGLTAYSLSVSRVTAREFTASLIVRKGGGDGTIRVTVSSTDMAGGTQKQSFYDITLD